MNKMTDIPRSNISNSLKLIKVPNNNIKYYDEKIYYNNQV